MGHLHANRLAAIVPTGGSDRSSTITGLDCCNPVAQVIVAITVIATIHIVVVKHGLRHPVLIHHGDAVLQLLNLEL